MLQKTKMLIVWLRIPQVNAFAPKAPRARRKSLSLSELFIVTAFLVFLPMESCRNPISTVYYLPQNFEGFLAVVYLQNHGTINQIVDGKRAFYIPENGLLLTKEAFFEDGDDIFVRKTDKGYDTLRTYVPIKEYDKKYKLSKRFDEAFTNDTSEIAVNFRTFANGGFNKFDKHGNEIGVCNFFFEIVTVGRASTLSDSAGQIFKKRIEHILQDSLCVVTK